MFKYFKLKRNLETKTKKQFGLYCLLLSILGLFSSETEYWSCTPGVESSHLSGGNLLIQDSTAIILNVCNRFVKSFLAAKLVKQQLI